MSTKPRSSQVRHIQNTKQLGLQSGATSESIISKINTELDAPLKLHASFPTPDAKLNFSDSSVLAADGAKKVLPAINSSVVTNLNGAWINFQNQTLSNAAHFTITFPATNTVGRFRIAAFELKNDFKINVTFSAEALTESALVDPGTLFTTGLPLGYVILECTNAAGYFKTAGSATNIIENTKIFRIAAGGGAGGGTGDASSILEDFKNQLIDSYFNFLSAEDFGKSSALVDSGNTTAVLDSGNGYYQMGVGQKVTTENLLDSSFFDYKQDIDQAMVTLRYKAGYVDTNPTVKLTRDSGVTWQIVSVSRNGQTDELSGILNFTNETLTQTAAYTVTGNRSLNTTTQNKLAQILTIPANTLKLVRAFTFNVTKIGNPNGKLIVKLVKEASGNPSLLDSNLISTVERNMSAISTGAVTVDFGNQVLKSGNYYLLFETDDAYQNSFVSGTTELQIRTNTIAPDAKAYNGTVWSSISGESIQYRYTYKDINLKLEITASASSRLVGFGVFYQKLTELVSPVSYDQIIVGSVAQVNAGLATHSSLQEALNSAGFSRRIKVLAETISENVTLSQNDVTIEGDGRGSVLSGNLTISGNNVVIEKMRITGNVTINGNSNFLDKVWLSVNSSVIDNGQNNSITGILE